MKLIKNIILWFFVGLLTIIALGTIPSFSSLAATVVVVLIIPIPKWQNILNTFIKGKIKTVIAVILAAVMLFTFPSTNEENNQATPDDTKKVISNPSTECPPDTKDSTNNTNNQLTESTDTITDSIETGNSNETTESTPSPDFNETILPNEGTTTTTESDPRPTHTHSFTAATCIDPKACSCGATEGTANGHNWKGATYAAPKTCTVCGATEGSTLDVPGKENYHGHVYTGGSSSTKYHYEEGCPGKNSHEITWNDVEKLNLDPCGKCVLN